MSEDCLRANGRAPDELRPLSMVTAYTRHAEGSVLIRLGDTHVLCNASVLDTVPAFLKGQGRGWVTAEYGMLPRATHTRSDREAVRGRQSGRTQEIQRLIGRSLRAVFDLQALGERTLQLDCDVLQADGSTRCAAITASWVAAAIAVRRLLADGVLAADPVLDHVTAVSVGLVGGRTLLDLDYREDAACDVDMNVIMRGDGRFVEVQGTAEGQSFGREALDALLDMAERGAAQLARRQAEVLRAAAGPLTPEDGPPSDRTPGSTPSE